MDFISVPVPYSLLKMISLMSQRRVAQDDIKKQEGKRNSACETLTRRKHGSESSSGLRAPGTYPMTSTAALRYGSTIISLAMLQPLSAAMMPTSVSPILSSVFRSTLATERRAQRKSDTNSKALRLRQSNVCGCFAHQSPTVTHR